MYYIIFLRENCINYVIKWTGTAATVSMKPCKEKRFEKTTRTNDKLGFAQQTSHNELNLKLTNSLWLHYALMSFIKTIR